MIFWFHVNFPGFNKLEIYHWNLHIQQLQLFFVNGPKGLPPSHPKKYIHSLKLTASSPLTIGLLKPWKEMSSSNHPFFRSKLAVSFRKGNYLPSQWQVKSKCPNTGSSPAIQWQHILPSPCCAASEVLALGAWKIPSKDHSRKSSSSAEPYGDTTGLFFRRKFGIQITRKVRTPWHMLKFTFDEKISEKNPSLIKNP